MKKWSKDSPTTWLAPGKPTFVDDSFGTQNVVTVAGQPSMHCLKVALALMTILTWCPVIGRKPRPMFCSYSIFSACLMHVVIGSWISGPVAILIDMVDLVTPVDVAHPNWCRRGAPKMMSMVTCGSWRVGWCGPSGRNDIAIVPFYSQLYALDFTLQFMLE